MKKIILSAFLLFGCDSYEEQVCYEQCIMLPDGNEMYCTNMCDDEIFKKDASIVDGSLADYGEHTCMGYCVRGEFKFEECMANVACCEAVCR